MVKLTNARWSILEKRLSPPVKCSKRACISMKMDKKKDYWQTSAPTWSLQIGWDMTGNTRNCPISKPSSGLTSRMAVILAMIGCQPICRDQSGALSSLIERLSAAPYFPSSCVHSWFLISEVNSTI